MFQNSHYSFVLYNLSVRISCAKIASVCKNSFAQRGKLTFFTHLLKRVFEKFIIFMYELSNEFFWSRPGVCHCWGTFFLQQSKVKKQFFRVKNLLRIAFGKSKDEREHVNKKNGDLIFKYVIFVTSAALHFCSSFQVSFVDQIRYNETNERERFSFLVFTIQIQVRYHVKPELISLTFCNLPNMHIHALYNMHVKIFSLLTSDFAFYIKV